MKTRVQSKYVPDALAKFLSNLPKGKRNIQAYKVATEGEERYFEDPRQAHRFAAIRARKGLTAKIFENVGGQQFIELATYHASFNLENKMVN